MVRKLCRCVAPDALLKICQWTSAGMVTTLSFALFWNTRPFAPRLSNCSSSLESVRSARRSSRTKYNISPFNNPPGYNSPWEPVSGGRRGNSALGIGSPKYSGERSRSSRKTAADRERPATQGAMRIRTSEAGSAKAGAGGSLETRYGCVVKCLV